MRIHVLYFAVLREHLAREQDALELEGKATVRDAIDALAQRHTAVASLRGRFRVAVNQEFASDDHALADGDELALIPPVAGGADADARHVRLQDAPLSLDRVIAAVTSPGVGGIVTFTGCVRRHSRGTIVERLEYEAYGEMAMRELLRLCDEIEREIAGAKLAVEHRVGTLAIGDLAVVIAAGAPHRAQAFEACRAMIDRLKDRVPIWKKEIGEDGAEWVGLGP
jgi:molybdopterin synthase catalytic subunit